MRELRTARYIKGSPRPDIKILSDSLTNKSHCLASTTHEIYLHYQTCLSSSSVPPEVFAGELFVQIIMLPLSPASPETTEIDHTAESQPPDHCDGNGNANYRYQYWDDTNPKSILWIVLIHSSLKIPLISVDGSFNKMMLESNSSVGV